MPSSDYSMMLIFSQHMVSKIAGLAISIKLIHNRGLSKQTGQAAQSSNRVLKLIRENILF